MENVETIPFFPPLYCHTKKHTDLRKRDVSPVLYLEDSLFSLYPRARVLGYLFLSTVEIGRLLRKADKKKTERDSSKPADYRSESLVIQNL